MNESAQQRTLNDFRQYYREYPELGLAIDLSRMSLQTDFASVMSSKLNAALREMRELEAGAIANKDENRMVGHYWLRNAALAPNQEIRSAIEQVLTSIRTFAADVHSGKIAAGIKPFKNILVIGIGGSALGPQFVSNALRHPATDKMQAFFLDNTDPDGMERVFSTLGSELDQTLCIVISKSGGTKETRNGMLEAQAAFRKAGLDFANHCVAVTSLDSELDKLAVKEKWIARFPMWDWVGGRTSELSAVGLLPAALQGFDIDQLLAGARACDQLTRANSDLLGNPAAALAAAWFYAGNGKGERNMVILPYKDRLELLAKYLQQLIMESIGKALDRDSKTVHQGITVLGNKGATDQHSYIQQLRDGLNDFFATFVVVKQDASTATLQVETNVTSGDYLHGFFMGTRQALAESGRPSLTIVIEAVNAFSVGVLIALYERAVGFYASMINVNAYHQPGVEAGKKAAAAVLQLQSKVLNVLHGSEAKPFTVTAIAAQAGVGADQEENIFWICEHLAANADRMIKSSGGTEIAKRTYTYIGKGAVAR